MTVESLQVDSIKEYSTAEPATSGNRFLKSVGFSADPVKAYRQIKRGVKPAVIDRLAKRIGVPKSVMVTVVHTTSATLSRRIQKKQLLSTEVSDRAYRVSSVIDHAIRLFNGNEDAAIRWFQSPVRALDYQTPFSYLDTEAGTQIVDTLISRLEHGVIT